MLRDTLAPMHDLLREIHSRHGIDVADGLQLLSLRALVERPFDPGMPVLLIPAEPGSTPVHVLPGRHARGTDAVAMLRALYPDDHPLLGLADTPATTVGEVSAAELDAGPRLLPALRREGNLASPHGLPWLVARLRAPDGCPWDREQDHLSLRKFLLEEAYEVYDALENGSTPALAEELGDLLLQIVLHAQYGAEAGVFDLADVNRAVMTKIIRRHPHVFGDVIAESASDVLRNWEHIKADERAQRSAGADLSAGTADAEMPAAFAGLSRSLPALAYAQEMQERAASLGYDWPENEGVLDKITEEARELIQATDDRARREELGDLLLVLVNLARRLGLDAESSLRAASSKFAARFAHVERSAAARNVELNSLSMVELDELWRAAKAGQAEPSGRQA